MQCVQQMFTFNNVLSVCQDRYMLAFAVLCEVAELT